MAQWQHKLQLSDQKFKKLINSIRYFQISHEMLQNASNIVHGTPDFQESQML
jgi:predicted Zn-dependent protease with MMP-like domain